MATRQLKRKAPGLVIIALIGLLQSLTPLRWAQKSPLPLATFGDAEAALTALRLPILFFLLWSVCFILVKQDGVFLARATSAFHTQNNRKYICPALRLGAQ